MAKIRKMGCGRRSVWRLNWTEGIEAVSQLNGTVKIFLKEKGYGFIFGDDGQQYFFYISDVAGGDLPYDEDIVSFEGGTNNKGLKATQVKITSKATKPPRRDYSDDKVVCSSCGKRMIPRVVFRHGQSDHSVCSFCGSTHQHFFHHSGSADNTGCFDALAGPLEAVFGGLGLLYVLYLVYQYFW